MGFDEIVRRVAPDPLLHRDQLLGKTLDGHLHHTAHHDRNDQRQIHGQLVADTQPEWIGRKILPAHRRRPGNHAISEEEGVEQESVDEVARRAVDKDDQPRRVHRLRAAARQPAQLP